MQKSHAQDIVRRHDYPRYLISLFAKGYEQKQALWALYAFNYEIAKTREIVSDTTLGLIRLTWWRDALKHIYGIKTEQPRREDEHPILPELAAAIKSFDLPYEQFDKLLLGREFDLEDLQPESIEGLLQYIDNTNTPLLKLTALVTDQDIQDDALQALSLANGLAGILRAIPFHAQHNIVLLPSSEVSKDAVLMGKTNTLKPIIKELYDIASNKLHSKQYSSTMRALSKLTKLNLRHICKSEFEPTQKKYSEEIKFLAVKMLF